MSARGVGIALGYAADRLLGDPVRFHPVAGFGRLSQGAERVLYRDSRRRGALHAVGLVVGAVALGALTERLTPRPVGRALGTAAATWTVLGGRSLERTADAVHVSLVSGDLTRARREVRGLVGRDTEELDPAEIARAVVESVAENTSDAVVAPLVWGAVAGVPGLLGYRAANTLDAMVGHRSHRYERYGWAAARFDDLVNLPGSRLTAVLTLVSRPSHARAAWRAWQRDAAAHPSPNAGVVEAAFAGALGVRLGGSNRYHGTRVEHRAILGDGRGVWREDIGVATHLARRVSLGAVTVAVAVSWAVDQRRARTQSPQ